MVSETIQKPIFLAFLQNFGPHAYHQPNSLKTNSSASEKSQQSKTLLIIAKRSYGFQLTIKQYTYSTIGLCSNIIYYLFIIKQSYKDHSKYASNQNQSLNDRMHAFNRHLI